MSEKFILETSALSKVYPGTVALNKVDFKAYEGKVNVLIGENGAGKSTLMKIIAGVEKPSDGIIYLDNKELLLSSIKDAEKHGIGIIFQELNLIPYMSILDNIFLGMEQHRFGNINYRLQEEKVKEVLNLLELNIDVNTKVADLRVGQQQLVEIAKALVKDVRILIMDEPTSALSNAEVEILFRTIAELKKQNVTIIYISHRLEELITIGDYITILRDGNLITTTKNDNISVDWIVDNMVGDVKKRKHKLRQVSKDKPVLQVRNLNMYDNLGKKKLSDVSFDMYKGELLGIYGLMGSGRSELFEAIFGVAQNIEGKIIFNGKDISKLPLSKRLRMGMSLVPEDRKNQAVIPPINIKQNMTVASIFRFAYKNLWISNKDEKIAVNQQVSDLSIKVASTDALLTSLSGGNQQKVVIAKSLLTRPKLLLLDECTRGVDVGAKAEIFDIVQSLVDNEGIAATFSSSDLGEIMDNSDRILVMSNGRLAGEFAQSQTNETELVVASTKYL